MGRALVVGATRSGVGAANLLAAQGYEVTVTDVKAEEELRDVLKGLSPPIGLALGGHPPGLFEAAELVVVSPGVPTDIELLQKAREAGAEVIGEFELAWRSLADVPFYAVTGTNGKSTTVTLLDRMMRESGIKSLLGGNIGNALTSELGRGGRPEADCVVAEVSSFQLETIASFRPSGAAVLNITPDHLDRYGSMSGYREAKARIAMNQRGEDFLVLNADDPECMVLYESAIAPRGKGAPKVFYFSRSREVEGVFLSNGTVCWDFRGAGSGELIGAGEIALEGVHNLENAMAASALALLAGRRAEAVGKALREFKGLAHRLESVREVDGVRYINDSKGTNVGAVIRSVESFTAPVVLIAGGRDKDGDFESLARAIKGRVRAAVLIGEAREKMMDAFEGKVEYYLADGLREAIARASGLASSGDVVLLSPACASFDMFRDFEERGEKFKQAVMQL
jgi:UDP-N-acetylmuramoylalanine--D-glutamate ligase